MPKTIDIKLDQIIKFPKSWWMQLGKSIGVWIASDAKNGILQGQKQTDTYRSQQYKKYKSNYMNRITDGKKLKAVKGQSVKNNDNSRVTMTLTGQLFRGLKPKSVVQSAKIIYGVLMSYLPKDADKIDGNENLGRDIRNLRPENVEKVTKEYGKEAERRIKQWASKKITVKV